jgi:FKBP-type peptidyl-prolyl cis-trans isomerase
LIRKPEAVNKLNMKSLRFILALSLTTLVSSFFSGCVDSEEGYDYYAVLQKDIQTIDAHLTSIGATDVIKDVRGVRMVVEELGTGLPANTFNKVKVAYVGKVLKGTASFDNGTVTGSALSGYIDGWIIAMTTLPVGSKATIYVPSPLGYGQEAKSGIPANSILVFDIDFLDVEETEVERQKLKSDTIAIDNYITQKGVTGVVKDTTGLRYKVTSVGAGPKPTWYSKVKMKLDYRLISSDANIVHSQTLEPSANFDSRVIDYIHGLKVGLQQLNEGSKVTLYIPSGLAYGSNDIYNGTALIIPKDSNIIIEAELLDVQ